MLVSFDIPYEMQEATDSSGGRIADHSDDGGVLVTALEQLLALADVALRGEQFFLSIAVDPVAVREGLVEQAILSEEPLQNRRAPALRRPANGDGKSGLLQRKEATIPAGRADRTQKAGKAAHECVPV
jgi:hypothetical protein